MHTREKSHDGELDMNSFTTFVKLPKAFHVPDVLGILDQELVLPKGFHMVCFLLSAKSRLVPGWFFSKTTCGDVLQSTLSIQRRNACHMPRSAILGIVVLPF